jgi:hypothetical protein
MSSRASQCRTYRDHCTSVAHFLPISLALLFQWGSSPCNFEQGMKYIFSPPHLQSSLTFRRMSSVHRAFSWGQHQAQSRRSMLPSQSTRGASGLAWSYWWRSLFFSRPCPKSSSNHSPNWCTRCRFSWANGCDWSHCCKTRRTRTVNCAADK